METIETIFKSSYLLRVLKGDYNPFTPNKIIITDKFIELRRRNWYLISVDSRKIHFQNVQGIDVDNHLIGTTIEIIGSNIKVIGFSKGRANQIKEECSKYIAKHTQRDTTEALSSAITEAIGKVQGNNSVSVADELKKLKELLDSNAISQAEYDEQKQRLLK